MSRQVIVIGGGASGIAAAIFAAGRGARVTVLEKGEKPLKKLLVTGNGRCNLTNLNCSEDSWRSTDPELARNMIRNFGVKETLEFFESIGVFTKDRDGWVYPVNDRASSVAAHLVKEAEALKIKIKTRENVTEVSKDDKGFVCRTETYEYRADAVMIASGSCAYYGDHYTSIAEQTARRFSVAYRVFEPALVPLVPDGSIVGKWGSDRLPGTARLYRNGKMLSEKTGELQLAPYGISGIPILQISSFIKDEPGAEYTVGLDFLPFFKAEELSDKIARLCGERPGRDMGLMLSGLFPEKLFRAVFDADETPESFIRRMKDLRLNIKKKKGFEHAMTASGGVLLSALNEHLEVPDVKGLFFIGEAADVDGDCGGYNLQWAWSSAHAAAAGLEL